MRSRPPAPIRPPLCEGANSSLAKLMADAPKDQPQAGVTLPGRTPGSRLTSGFAHQRRQRRRQSTRPYFRPCEASTGGINGSRQMCAWSAFVASGEDLRGQRSGAQFSLAARRQVNARLVSGYQNAARAALLNQLDQVTGWHRDHARRGTTHRCHGFSQRQFGSRCSRLSCLPACLCWREAAPDAHQMASR